jgi:hypothetical protein
MIRLYKEMILMKKVIILCLLNVFILSYLYGVRSLRYFKDEAKKRAVNQSKIDSLKAKVNFEGSIIYDDINNKFRLYKGNFTDIKISSNPDSTEMKEIFEQVYIKAKPFFIYGDEPVLQDKMEISSNSFSIKYSQEKNGKKYEGQIIYFSKEKCFFFKKLEEIIYHDMEEYTRQRTIMQERAERFKQETGFEGTITQHFRENGPMRFGSIGGNFSDIVVTAKEDTVIMKQVFEQVRAKVMPYVKAEEGQLFAEKVTTDITVTRVIYNQKINGYPVYRSGRLVIDYNFSTSEFIITDNTREISAEYVPINITEDEAIEIVKKHYGETSNSIFVIRTLQPPLAYSPINEKANFNYFKLCYLVKYNDILHHIDPTTGNIIYYWKIPVFY